MQAEFARVPLADSTVVPVHDTVTDVEALMLGDILPTGAADSCTHASCIMSQGGSDCPTSSACRWLRGPPFSSVQYEICGDYKSISKARVKVVQNLAVQCWSVYPE